MGEAMLKLFWLVILTTQASEAAEICCARNLHMFTPLMICIQWPDKRRLLMRLSYPKWWAVWLCIFTQIGGGGMAAGASEVGWCVQYGGILVKWHHEVDACDGTAVKRPGIWRLISVVKPLMKWFSWPMKKFVRRSSQSGLPSVIPDTWGQWGLPEW